MTVRMSIMGAYVRWRNRCRHNTAAFDRSLGARGTPAPVPADIEQWCTVSVNEISNRRVITLTPRGRTTGVHVIHTHGGAYVYAIQQLHWQVLGMLSRRSGAVIHVPLYGLAPTSKVDQAYPFLQEVYLHVKSLAGGGPVVLSGDSAGGGLALGQAIRYRQLGLTLPSHIMLFSPWLDLTVPERLDPRLNRLDPMLSQTALRRAGLLWTGSISRTDPMVSPINDTLVGLPHITTFVGGRDILLEDAQRLHEKVLSAGGKSTLRIWASGFHVFMAATKTREAREVMTAAADILSSAPLTPSRHLY